MPELRPEWVCTACAMRVYNACGDAIPRPGNWKGDLCHNCAKEEAKAESDREFAQAAGGPNAVASLLEADPGRSNAEISRLTGTKEAGVSKKRKELGLPNVRDYRTQHGEGLRSGSREKARTARERIESGPPMPDKQIAADLGIAAVTVRKIRKELGRSAPLPRCDECGRTSTKGGSIVLHQKGTGHTGISWVEPDSPTVGSI